MSRAPAMPRNLPTDTPLPAAQSPANSGYLFQTTLPLTSLIFLAPMIILYEIGTRFYAFDPVSHTEQRIIAFSLMQQFFSALGATGKYMPPAAVVSILLCCHIARGDSWTTHIGHLCGMLIESVIYAIPLRVLALLFAHYLPLYVPAEKANALIVLSIGAGVYEEMVFRLFLFTAMSALFVDLFKMSKLKSFLLMVAISSILFSAYHYLGQETFEMRSFLFRTLAGVYFGLIFTFRGFGITAGAHAAYDISTVAVRLIACR